MLRFHYLNVLWKVLVWLLELEGASQHVLRAWDLPPGHPSTSWAMEPWLPKTAPGLAHPEGLWECLPGSWDGPLSETLQCLQMERWARSLVGSAFWRVHTMDQVFPQGSALELVSH